MTSIGSSSEAFSTLVTGANGFVGVNLVRALARKGARVLALARANPDSATRRYLEDVAELIQWTVGDVRDRKGLCDLVVEHDVKRIVHSAAITPTSEVERDKTAAVIDVNLMGTVNVLEAARAVNARRVVLVSSSGLFGSPTDPRRVLHEDQTVEADTLYTICKEASEKVCRLYAELHNLSVVSGRLGTAYGPMERASRSRKNMSFIYQLAHHALAGDTIRVSGSGRVRDVIHVSDAAEAFARLTLAPSLRWERYNVAGEQVVTLRDMLQALNQLRPVFRWHEVDDCEEADVAIAPGRERAPLSQERLRRDVEFEPCYDLIDGLQSYLDWLETGGWTL